MTEADSPSLKGDMFVMRNVMSRDPKSAVMFFARSFAAVNGLLYGITTLFAGSFAMSCFQRTLFAFGLASIIRLSQRLGPIQLTKMYFINVVLEDSAHYFLYSCNFYSHTATSLVAIVPTLYCTVQSSVYLLNLLAECKTATFTPLIVQLTRVKANQQVILRLVATAEIFIMPLIIMQMFLGQCGSILTPLVYYQFLMLRFMSRRNPYVRNAFTELKLSITLLLDKPMCPVIVKTVVLKGMSLVEKLAPSTAPPPAQYPQ